MGSATLRAVGKLTIDVVKRLLALVVPVCLAGAGCSWFATTHAGIWSIVAWAFALAFGIVAIFLVVSLVRGASEGWNAYGKAEMAFREVEDQERERAAKLLEIISRFDEPEP